MTTYQVVLVVIGILNFLIPIGIVEAAHPLGWTDNLSAFLVSAHESLCSIFVATILLKMAHPKRECWIRALSIGLVFLAMADFVYGIDYYLLGYRFKNTPWILLHEGPYVAAMSGLALSSVRRGLAGLADIELKWATIAVGLVSMTYFALSYWFILSFQFPLGYHRPVLNYFTSYAYGIAQAVAAGGITMAYVRSLDAWEGRAWAILLTLLASDFSLRLQDVLHKNFGVPYFEISWALALSALLTLFLLHAAIAKHSGTESFALPAELFSLRVVLPSVSAVTLFVLLLSSAVVNWQHSAISVEGVSRQGLLIVVIWMLANEIAREISSRSMKGGKPGGKSFLEIKSWQELKALDTEMKQVAHELANSQMPKSESDQLLHDLRSPIAALSVALSGSDSLDEDALALAKLAVERVKGIASQWRRKPATSSRVCRPWDVVARVAREKTLLYVDRPGVRIRVVPNSAVANCEARIDGSVLARIFSNLVDNAADAISGCGDVSITICEDGNFLICTIRDTGKGIPAELMPHVGQLGFTSGKSNGNGMGVFHAKSELQALGGDLKIASIEGEGTAVEMLLPRSTDRWNGTHSARPQDAIHPALN